MAPPLPVLLLAGAVALGTPILPAGAETTTDPLALGLPRLCWGTRPDRVLRGLTAAGIRPVLLRGKTTELAWDARFGNTTGRASPSFDGRDRLEQIALVLPVTGTGEENFEQWSRRLSAFQAAEPRPLTGAADWVRSGTLGGNPW